MCRRSGVRTILTISYVLHYCMWVCFSMMAQTTDKIDWIIGKSIFYLSTAFLLLFYILIGQNCEKYLAQFKTICLLSIMSIFLVLTANYLGFINNAYFVIKYFCGLVFVTSCMVLISGIRHGVLKEQQ